MQTISIFGPEFDKFNMRLLISQREELKILSELKSVEESIIQEKELVEFEKMKDEMRESMQKELLEYKVGDRANEMAQLEELYVRYGAKNFDRQVVRQLV